MIEKMPFRFAPLVTCLLLAACEVTHSGTHLPDGGARNDAGSGQQLDASIAPDGKVVNVPGDASDGAMADADADGGGDITKPLPLTNPWIAFTQLGIDGFGQLALVRADGTGLKVWEGDTYEADPSWSPDGTKLAFIEYAPGVGTSLRVWDFVTGKSSEVPTQFIQITRPRWVADGKSLVVAATSATVSEFSLFRIDVPSGAVEQLTDSPSGDGGHDLTADGMLYFVRRVAGESFDIFSSSLTAGPKSSPTRLTTDAGVLGGVSVHPDGKRLYYGRGSGASAELVERTIASGEERVIGDAGDQEPRAFVGGHLLVLSRISLDADSEIAVVRPDGTLVTRCTNDTSFDTAPAPSPLESADMDISGF